MSCAACGGPTACAQCAARSGAPAVYDVVVVGAGVIGSAIARELSRYDISVAVLEKADDVCQGASKANSGIVHGGYDAAHGTLKSRMSRRGNQLFSELERELDFGFKRCGSLVLAFTAKEQKELERLMANGRANGVDDLVLLDGAAVRAMEPHVSVGVRQALFCPSAGIVSPYEYCHALVENAAANGVRFLVGHEVVAVESLGDLRARESRFRVRTARGLVLTARSVVNAGGLHADQVARMAGAALQYTVQPRKGQYLLLDREQGGEMARRVIFQTPTERWGKGILVSPTARGNLLLGPSAAEQDSRDDTDTDAQELAYVAWAARRSVPHLDTRHAITSFSGLRARVLPQLDFIIEQDSALDRFVHVAGIESPGLTSSPAIALHVAEILRNDCKLELRLKQRFDAVRRHPVNFSDAPKPGELICKCENITREEIERAIDQSVQSGVPVTSTDAVKWRTRAGMGHCQGARCRAEVADIVARKLANGATLADIPKQIPGSRPKDRPTRAALAKL